MTDHIELGKLGEKMAAEHLDKKGFQILHKNYVYGRAEVDIVAMKDNTIVFVEVKTRESSYLSAPEYTVSLKKQRQIIKAADAYLKEHQLEQESRFDIISIIINSQYNKLEHLEHAFYPTG